MEKKVVEHEIELIDIIEAYASQFRPRPYSLDPSADNYKAPEVGEYIDWWDGDTVEHGHCWKAIDEVMNDKKYFIGYLWLPSRTKDDFGR